MNHIACLYFILCASLLDSLSLYLFYVRVLLSIRYLGFRIVSIIVVRFLLICGLVYEHCYLQIT